jgi:hypothetical protein
VAPFGGINFLIWIFSMLCHSVNTLAFLLAS